MRAVVAAVRLYQLCVGPLLGPCCRFHPTCSDFACQALQQHGLIRGAWLAFARVMRCHPWSAGGHDPVP